MALARKLTKAKYEKLSDELKAEYKEVDGEYVLDVEGDEDTSSLKRAKDREVQKRKEAEEKLKELQDQLDGISDTDARKKGDIETLEKSWKDKYDKREKELVAKIEGKDGFIKSALVDNVASNLAHKISNAPSLILPHIKARLAADLDGETPVTKVLDKDGKVSALSVEDLEKEFVANKDFSAIIIGSKASGGGASTSNLAKPGGSATLNNNQQAPDLAKLSPAELGARLKAQREAQQ